MDGLFHHWVGNLHSTVIVVPVSRLHWFYGETRAHRLGSRTMSGKRVDLFTVFGFTVCVDAGWLFIAALLTWSLATAVFPGTDPGLLSATYWWMGVIGTLGLFASVVVHELSHSLVARHQGTPMQGITLFIFGGVAEMRDEPASPRAEFLMAVIGPLTSLLVALVLYVVAWAGTVAGWPAALLAVLDYFATLNAILAGFNLIPAFPLDGGRVLRSALWRWKGSLRWATRVSAGIGSGFGVLLIVLGVFALFSGNPVGGMWWVLLGLFVRNAAGTTYQQLLLRQALSGESVRRFMQSQPVTVPRRLSLRQLVEEYIYRFHYKMFPVVDDGRLLGCVTTAQVRAVPREEWDRQTVGAIVEPCSPANGVS
ncbi:MAG TPA: site-2 protease family protein, partial [Acidimicrobiales bacterium]|nr:site-2 protease family protein [Acidimicrobiales bacterium]